LNHVARHAVVSRLAGRLLVLKAGSGASNNLIRSLKSGDPSCFIVGCHADRFVLKKSPADRNYLVPSSSHAALRRALCKIINAERIDLAIPNNEEDVTTVSDLRDRLPCRVFLPRRAVIERCQDKYKLTIFLRRRGIPVPMTYPVTDLKDIVKTYRRLAPCSELWCRIRRGTGSIGAILVKSPEQTRSWIRYWEKMRGVPAGSFILSEYLPGRDFCFQGLWQQGRLVMAKMHERLSYHVAGGGPSGMSSTAALAKMIYEPRVLNVSKKAILALDAKASGVFFVDLKENPDGEPCITEINAGRFANVPTIHDLAGEDNMAIAYVRAALGEPVRARKIRKPDEACYVLRDLDTLPAVFRAAELFEGIDDARG
jgi:glutathione synthase/RimK-type ligase-like ATP-grasp enzyme